MTLGRKSVFRDYIGERHAPHCLPSVWTTNLYRQCSGIDKARPSNPFAFPSPTTGFPSLHSIALISLHLLPSLTFTNTSRRPLVAVAPLHTALSIFPFHPSFASSIFPILPRTSLYSPSTSSGQDQYPKSGITHFDVSDAARDKTQTGCLFDGSAGQSPRFIVNSRSGRGVGDVIIARCIECSNERARVTS